MNKIAQRRGLLNKIREKINTPGEAISGALSPEFVRLMDTLRDVDDEARENAIDLKDMLKVARSSFNRREYMSSISYLGKFHERLELVRWQFTKLSKDADMIHNEFLFGDLDEEHKANLFEKMPERFKPKAKTQPKKEAGLKDWWHNINSDRGKSLKYWEKRFPKAAKEIKRQTEKMLNRSEMFLNVLMSTFKSLATFRATRKLEEYIKISSGWVQKYDAYDNAFNEYFNGSVKKFIDSQKEFEDKKKEDKKILEERKNRPMENGNSGDESNPESPDSEADRSTGEFTKAQPPTDPREQDKKEVEEAIKNEINGPKSGWPVRKTENTLTLREPSTAKDPVVNVDSIEPSTPQPSSGDKVRGFLPVDSTEAITQNLAPVSEITLQHPNKNVIQTHPSAHPLTPTMRSPSPPSGSIDLSNPIIPPNAKVPSLSDLSKPPTSSQLSKFYYYEPPVAVPAGPPTVRPGKINQPEKPKLELVDETETPSTRTYNLPSTALEFVEKLTKVADQNPLILAKEIIKFAKSIEVTDKITSDKLLTVARNLLK